MNDVVEQSMNFTMSLKLTGQAVGMCKVQFQKVQFRLLQVFPATRCPDSGPGVESPA